MFTRKEPYEGEKDLVALAFRIAVQGHRLTIPPTVPAPITLLMKYAPSALIRVRATRCAVLCRVCRVCRVVCHVCVSCVDVVRAASQGLLGDGSAQATELQGHPQA